METRTGHVTLAGGKSPTLAPVTLPTHPSPNDPSSQNTDTEPSPSCAMVSTNTCPRIRKIRKKRIPEANILPSIHQFNRCPSHLSPFPHLLL